MTSPTVEDDGAAQFAFWLRFWRWVVAVQQVVGGLWGIYILAFGPLRATSRVFLLVGFALFSVAIGGGVLLALRRPAGVKISLVIQALQVLQIATGYFVYLFNCGAELLVGPVQTAMGPDVQVGLYFGARFTVFINSLGQLAPGRQFVGVNVVAVLAIICLLYVRAAERKRLMPAQVADNLPVAHETKGVWPPPPEP